MNQWTLLNKSNIRREHICCAFSDKKHKEGYLNKKRWIESQLQDGFIFEKLNVRGKVFIEMIPSEKAWMPIVADNYFVLGCFWVSGRYKKQGYGKELLHKAIGYAQKHHKNGIIAVCSEKKRPFMSDALWLKRHGFVEIERLPSGISLYVLKLRQTYALPHFKNEIKAGKCDNTHQIIVYYTSGCPYTSSAVQQLEQTAQKLCLTFKSIHVTSYQQAQDTPTPIPLFSIFYDGEYLTSDISTSDEKKLKKALAAKNKKVN